MISLILVFSLLLAGNGFLVMRYRQKKITFITDLLSRMAGVSFFILYIWYQLTQHLILSVGFHSPVQILSWINWILTLGVFVFFIVAYLIRTNPVARAKGIYEVVLPLWCGATPALLLLTPHWFPVFSGTLPWKLTSFLFLVAGHTLTFIGFLYLGRAFSIMVQARHVVQHGPYRFIRHPIYVGESIAMIGIFLNVPNWINLVWVILWILAQWKRAGLEEKKLATTFESYTTYKQKTGGIFPKITR